MQRRFGLTLVVGGGLGLVGCRQEAGPAATTGQKQDVKTLAASLQTKTTAMITALNARNEQQIATAKRELETETNRVEDAIKSETGPAANRVNAAVGRIKQALIPNQVPLLEQARDLLQQAQQA